MAFDFGMSSSFLAKMKARKETFHHKDRSFVRCVYAGAHTVCKTVIFMRYGRDTYFMLCMCTYYADVCLQWALQGVSIAYSGVSNI